MYCRVVAAFPSGVPQVLPGVRFGLAETSAHTFKEISPDKALKNKHVRGSVETTRIE